MSLYTWPWRTLQVRHMDTNSNKENRLILAKLGTMSKTKGFSERWGIVVANSPWARLERPSADKHDEGEDARHRRQPDAPPAGGKPDEIHQQIAHPQERGHDQQLPQLDPAVEIQQGLDHRACIPQEAPEIVAESQAVDQPKSQRQPIAQCPATPPLFLLRPEIADCGEQDRERDQKLDPS